MLREQQMLQINKGNAWDCGFVQGMEYILKYNGESLEGDYNLEKYSQMF